MSAPVGGRHPQRGAVLIIVLWVIMLLSMLLATYTRSIRVETGIVRGMVNDVSVHAVAEGIVSYLAKLRTFDVEIFASLEGGVQEITIGNQNAYFRMIPEASYVSLNSASLEMLQALISGVSEGAVDAESLAAAIVDWRDTDDVPLELGAEKAEYDLAGFAWRPRDNDFESADELRLVLGVTPALANRLKPHVSVHAKSQFVNPVHASSELIELLGGEAGIIDSAGKFESDDESDLLVSGNGFFAVNQSNTYRIQAALVVDGEKKDTGLELVVSFGSSGPSFDLKGDSPPYHIKQWNRYTSHFEKNDE